MIIDYGRPGISGDSLRVGISFQLLTVEDLKVPFLIQFLLQAFKKHQIVDFFQTPGECDLTANVDFMLLREAMSDAGESREMSEHAYSQFNLIMKPLAEAHGPLTQARFLKEMGITVRLMALEMARAAAKRKMGEEGKWTSKEYRSLNPNTAAAYRLLDPNGMGVQYKVLGITGIGGREKMTSEEERGCYPFCIEELREEEEERWEKIMADD